MALSGSTAKQYTSKGAYWVWVEWSGTQNIANNTTTITAITYAGTNSYGWYATNNNGSSVTVNGATTSVGDSGDISANTSKKELCRRTEVVSHNADGTKSVTISGRWWMNGTAAFDLTSTGTFTLNTIPRTSTPTLSASTQAIGSAITIYTNRASTSFTHTISYAFGSASGTIATGVGDSVAWTLPATLANQIPTAVSGYGTITLNTYSGSTLIGTKSINFTATVPDTASYRPTASTPSKSIYGSGRDKTIAKYVQGISRVTVSFTATAQGGASITSSYIDVSRQTDNGNSMNIPGTSGTSGTLALAGTYLITATTTDSRGRSTSSTTTFVVEAYAVPKINSYTAVRNSTTKTTVNNNASGTYTYMGGSNSLTVVIAKKTIAETSFTNLNTTSGTTSGTFSNTFASTGNTETVSYHFRVTITDTFGNSATSIVTVSTSSFALSIKRDTGIGVGKIWERGALDVGGDAFVTGVMQPSGGVMSPFGVLGGPFGAGRPTTANLIPIGDTTMKHLLATSTMTEGYPGDDGYIMHFEWDTTAGWSSQLAISNTTVSTVRVRGLSPSGWGPWKKILTEDNQYSVPINVDRSRMASLTNEVRVSLPVTVGERAIWLVVIKANQNPGGSSDYVSNFVGILSAPGTYDGTKVVFDPEWTSLSAQHGMGALIITPYAIVSGKGYVATATAGSEANNSPLGLIISNFSPGYPTLVARNVVVTIKRLY